MSENKEYRKLDPIKVAWTGLRHFSNKYELKGNYNERLEALRELTINTKDYEEKKQMGDILFILYKINKCELCNGPIIWDDLKNQAVVNPKTQTARHLNCHKNAEEAIIKCDLN